MFQRFSYRLSAEFGDIRPIVRQVNDCGGFVQYSVNPMIMNFATQKDKDAY